MNQNLFKRLMELSKKTGDRIVFADVEGNEAHVVLSLNDYERLVTGEVKSPKLEAQTSNSQLPSSTFQATAAKPITRNPIEEMNREIVRSLEAERDESPRGRREAKPQAEDMEVEERYFLEPIE